MPFLAILAAAAIIGFVLTHHPADPSGALVSDIKKGRKYLLFVYAPPGHTPADVHAEINDTLGMGLVITAEPVLMGTGVLPGTTTPAETWAIGIQATTDETAVAIDSALTGTGTYFYQALQAA